MPGAAIATTTPGGRARSSPIDALRGVAAVMVLSTHAISMLVPAGASPLPVWNVLSPRLNSGFQLFFVVSGFLIGGPFIRALLRNEPLPMLAPYAVRRVLRVGPAFWAVLLVYVLVAGGAVDWGSVALHATFMHDLAPHQSGAILPVAWTLGIEAMFYALVPLAATLLRRRARAVSLSRLVRLLLAAWVLSAAWELACSLAFHGPYGSAGVSPRDDTMKLFTISLPGMLYMFCPGLLVAAWHCAGRGAGAVERHAGLTVLAGCALWCVAALIEFATGGIIGAGLGDLVRGFAFAAVLIGAVCWRRRPGRLLSVAAGAGVVSYGIYLWHWIVIHVLQIAARQAAPFGGPLGTPMAIGAALLATLCVAAISWRLIEAPCLGWAATLSRRLESRRAAAGQAWQRTA